MLPLKQRSPTFPAPGTGFVEDSFSTYRGDARDGAQLQMERQPAARLPLSCCAARPLTGRGPVPVCTLGVGTSALKAPGGVLPPLLLGSADAGHPRPCSACGPMDPPLQSLLHHHMAIPPASLFRGLSASSLKDIRPPIPSQLISHQQNKDLFLNEVIF